MKNRAVPTLSRTIDTGVEGLNFILGGGLPANRLYLVEGEPGSGKTTLALQYLLAGRAAGERCLYVTLSETREELESVALSHGLDLTGIDIFELSTADYVLGLGGEQTLLHPWEVELGATIGLITAEIDRTQPSRVVFDSLSEMRLLAQDPLRYRRQILALKQYFVGKGATVILIDDMTTSPGDRDETLHSICHGVISLERVTLEFGAIRRRLQVRKMRGVAFAAGYNDMAITHGGVVVYPRLIAANFHADFIGDPVASGVAEIDALLGGGPLRGTTSLLTGPAGAGKTTLALQYLYAACERGENATFYEFDERVGTLFARAKAMGLDLGRHAASGRLKIEQVDPSEISPGEFAWRVQREVEHRGVRLLVVDSLDGYIASMQEGRQLILQLHELLSYLNQQGVATFLINPQSGLLGTMSTGQLNISYVCDTIFLFRFFEAEGRLRKALSVLKNRGGAHEDAIRELRIDSKGIRVGDPLTAFRGVLTGTPTFVGNTVGLMEARGDARD